MLFSQILDTLQGIVGHSFFVKWGDTCIQNKRYHGALKTEENWLNTTEKLTQRQRKLNSNAFL